MICAILVKWAEMTQDAAADPTDCVTNGVIKSGKVEVEY